MAADEVEGGFEGREEEEGFEEGDGEEVVAEEGCAEGDDGGGQRHARGVKADGVAKGAHGFGADGEAVAVEEGEGGGSDEVGEGEDGDVGVGAIEGEDGGEREGDGEGKEKEEEAAVGALERRGVGAGGAIAHSVVGPRLTGRWSPRCLMGVMVAPWRGGDGGGGG